LNMKTKTKTKKSSWLSKNPKANYKSLTTQTTQEVTDSIFKLPGLVETVGELIERESGFRKKELVIKTHDYKAQLVRFEFLNYKLELLDGLLEGEKVEVTFRIEGGISPSGQVLNNLIGTELVKLSEQAVSE
jgi:hypothetical protein